jgi:hypothetical protein
MILVSWMMAALYSLRELLTDDVPKPPFRLYKDGFHARERDHDLCAMPLVAARWICWISRALDCWIWVITAPKCARKTLWPPRQVFFARLRETRGGSPGCFG